MPKDRSQLRLGQSHVQRHQDGASLRHSEVALKQLVIIETEVGDAIPVRNSQSPEPCGQALCTELQFAVSEVAFAADNADAIAQKGSGAMQASKRR
jgi:hypothetical protein